MRRIAWMVRKDLLRRLRQPLGIGLLLAFPLVFSLMIAVTFGTGGSSFPKVRLLVEDRDDNLVGNFLSSALTSPQFAENFDVEAVGEEGMERMERGEASALLRIPDQFTEDLLDGKPTSLELVRNPSEGIMPEVAEQIATVLTDVLSSGSRVLRGPLETLKPLLDADEGPSDLTVTSMAVAANRIANQGSIYLFPPAITLETVSLEGDEDADGSGSLLGSIFLTILPGISVYALFMLGDLAMRDIVTELTAKTLQRQLTGTVGGGTVVVAKAIYTAILSLISLTILSAFGWFASSRGVDLAGFALLSLALIAAVTGFASVIYGSAPSERGGATIGSVFYLILAFTSGSFVPIENLPATLQRLAAYNPFHWATSGYRSLIEDGATLGDVALNAGILAGSGMILLALGGRLLLRSVQRGAGA